MPTPDLELNEAALQQEFGRIVQPFTVALVDRIATTAQAETVPVRSGRMKAAIRPDSVQRSGPWSFESGVTVGVDYAAAVHEGARPHVIRPVRARALRWFDSNGQAVFAQRVNHPGNAPNPFLTNAGHRVMSADPRIDFLQ